MAKFFTNLIQVTGLTADGVWRTIDLSQSPYNLPASATGVMLVIRNTSSTSVLYGFRKLGSTDTQRGDIVSKAQYTAFVGLDPNRRMQYNLSSSGVNVYVTGYFEYEAEFLTNGIALTTYINNTWTNVSLSQHIPSNSKWAILEVIDFKHQGQPFGCQPGGSSAHDVKLPLRYHTWVLTGVDTIRRVAIYAHSSHHTIYLVGWVVSGSQKTYPLSQKNPGTTDNFVDINLTNDGPPPQKSGAVFWVFWHPSEEQEKRFLYRKKNSSDDWDVNCELRGMCYYAVGIDDNNICQIKHDDGYQQNFFLGFLDDPLIPPGFEAVTSIEAEETAGQIQEPFEASTSIIATVALENHLSIELPEATVQIIGDSTIPEVYPIVSGNISLILGGPSLIITGHTRGAGFLNLITPVFHLFLTGDQVFIEYKYRAFVVNMSNYAVTEYKGYNFNSLAYFKGKVYGANKNGIYVLEGDNDNGTSIQARIKFPIIDTSVDTVKKTRDIWLTSRDNKNLLLIVHFDEGNSYEDIFQATGIPLEYRAKMPKGIKSRFIAFEVRNFEGGNFDINSLRFTVDTIPRRRR